MNPKNYRFHKKIAIYSHRNTEELMIFEQIENINEFKLLDWKSEFFWERVGPYSPAIFQIPIPVRGNLPDHVNSISEKYLKYVLSSYFNEIQQKG